MSNAIRMSDRFLQCGCGDEYGERCVDIGPAEYGVCETCKKFWYVSSLSSRWKDEAIELGGRSEAEKVWDQRRQELCDNYQLVDLDEVERYSTRADYEPRCGCESEFGDLTWHIGRHQYGTCETHGYYWHVGENLLSAWRHELEELGNEEANRVWTEREAEMLMSYQPLPTTIGPPKPIKPRLWIAEYDNTDIPF